MSQIKLWGWDKKERTMLRYIRSGDIFCFQYDKSLYQFGRIISKIPTGHVAEIFDFESTEPIITRENINNSSRLIDPIILDSYSLFDKKREDEGEWRIIGHEENFIPQHVENVYFAYGDAPCKKVDIFGNEITITATEAEGLPRLSPLGIYHINRLIKGQNKH